jgi:Transposase DDE domain
LQSEVATTLFGDDHASYIQSPRNAERHPRRSWRDFRFNGTQSLNLAERLKARPDILDRRRETVEHPFGTIKQWMNQGAFLMRGLDKVRAEFSLTALVYNLRRALNILGVERLMEAVAA